MCNCIEEPLSSAAFRGNKQVRSHSAVHVAQTVKVVSHAFTVLVAAQGRELAAWCHITM